MPLQTSSRKHLLFDQDICTSVTRKIYRKIFTLPLKFNSNPLIYEALNTLNSNANFPVLVADGLNNEVLRLAKKLDILAYSYFPSTTVLLSLFEILGHSSIDGFLCHFGKEIRQRMEKLKGDAIDALKKNGSSTRTLTQLALKWKRFRVTSRNLN
ncbi:hypothetical protein MTR_8g006280 [Medicago truncatula]|uniref:Uncharacterized protein n=1 Tax=Medicago truncatula TaxID=3880 RepID=G7LBM4_MEDTR|nr:hypothetical protein MTR_8g006280 [Medicago truncatula]